LGTYFELGCYPTLQVFNPNHAPPVSIHKPPFNFSHRKISVISADLIQNLTHNSVALPISLDPPSGNIMQLTLEAETNESITHDSLNAQKSTLTQDNSLDAAENGDTFQPELTSINYERAVSGSITVGDDVDRKEPFTARDHQPSISFQIPRFNVPSITGDIIQLDQLANVECNGDSSNLCQSTNYIVFTPQKNYQGQQTSITSVVDMNIMLDNYEDNIMNALDDVNENRVNSGQLPPTSSTNIVNGFGEALDTSRCDYVGKSPPTSTRDDIGLDSAAANISTIVENHISASQDDESCALNYCDSDKGSLFSLDIPGDVLETLNYSDQLVMNQSSTLSENGYL
jgi:hypothetical protein